jgi:glycosyltransferase involved in cell wall biosynthesis
LVANTTWYIHNFRAHLISTLIERGYGVAVFSPSDKYVDCINAVGARHIHLELQNAGTNPLRELLTLSRMYSVLRLLRPSLILSFTPKMNIYTSLAARLLGVPTIANVSGLGRAFAVGGWLEYIARRLYSTALSHPKVVFFQNLEDMTEFTDSRLVDPMRAKRLPGSGVDVVRFQPRPKPEFDKGMVFLLVARMIWDKGVGEFVEAARRVKSVLPGTNFYLLGPIYMDNPAAISREQIKSWEKEAVVEYLGETDSVEDVYARCDCVVLPSYYREGVPRSLLEAASMGIPIITTDMAGCRDTLDDGKTGYLCQARNAESLAACMLRMASLTKADRKSMGDAGRRKMVREFDEQIVISCYMDEIQELLKR